MQVQSLDPGRCSPNEEGISTSVVATASAQYSTYTSILKGVWEYLVLHNSTGYLLQELSGRKRTLNLRTTVYLH